MSPPNIHSFIIKDERWVIKTFRPLLKLLDVQHIPNPPESTMVNLAEYRDFVIKGMSRCIVIIEQDDLPKNIGGMLITSRHTGSVRGAGDTSDAEIIDFYVLDILINRNLCNKTNLNDRIDQKIAAIHEFTHAVATLSALSRVRTEGLVEKLTKLLKDRFKDKANAIYYDDIKQVAAELNKSLIRKLNTQKKTDKNDYFPDEHFRLGFEDIPVSYPVIFEEFLFSHEIFEEYLSRDAIQAMCKAVLENNSQDLARVAKPVCLKISEEKALDIQFVVARFFDILTPFYSAYARKAHLHSA